MSTFKSIATGIVLIVISFHAHAQWNPIGIGTTAHFYSVYFPTSTVGYIVGDSGLVYKSTDAGATWVRGDVGVDATLNGVFFTDANNGVVVGDSSYILRTTNGGSTWSVVNNAASANSSTLDAVMFPSPSVGYACGWGKCVLKTTDAGATWTRQTNNGTRDYRGIAAYDDNHAVAVGYSQIPSSTCWGYTADGNNWSHSIGAAAGGFNAVQFVSSGLGYAVGAIGDIEKTTDGGQTFAPVAAPTADYLYGLYFLSATEGYVVGMNQHILKTQDGGATWISTNYAVGTRLESIFMIDQNIGIAVGESGKVLRTTNGAQLPVVEVDQPRVSVGVYPNPVTSESVIEIDDPALTRGITYDLKITDALGREVLDIRNSDAALIRLNRDEMASGLFFYVLRMSDNRVATGKFIVE